MHKLLLPFRLVQPEVFLKILNALTYAGRNGWWEKAFINPVPRSFHQRGGIDEVVLSAWWLKT
jgi:hypothetical protein